jgi:ribonuclease HI
MNGLPPFPPNGAKYSPSRAYDETPGFSYPPAGPPPAFTPFDAYGTEHPRPPFAYEQPSRPYDSEAYDPYQPASANAYNPVPPPPPIAFPPFQPPRAMPPATVPRAHNPAPGPSIPTRFSQHEPTELTLLTESTSVNLAGEAINVHSLPPSHLPIDKYVATSPAGAINVHRQLCRNASSIWYADGSSRAGEGWSAAIEWIIDSSRSGAKMRGCVGNGDALDAELGGICKAVEGFQEVLHQSIKDGKPMSHELIVFSDSQAAIVAIDTSSRPEALRFDRIWREICSEFPSAHLRLAWLPKGTSIEGHVLADKIATVGASNSYLKRKKENTLPEVYRRPNGGEPAPGGSTEAGPWQRGDADPSRRKSPFERPKPLLPSPYPEQGLHLDTGGAVAALSENGVDEELTGAKPGSIFVTQYVLCGARVGKLTLVSPTRSPPKTLAYYLLNMAICMLTYHSVQHGLHDSVSVDIFHISQGVPRFAIVSYSDPASGLAAIDDLHHRAINLDTPFGRDNQVDLDIWRQWQGKLTVVLSDPSRLVPASVADEFPNLPEWALGNGKDRRDDREDDRPVHDRGYSPAQNRKRDHAGIAAEP